MSQKKESAEKLRDKNADPLPNVPHDTTSHHGTTPQSGNNCACVRRENDCHLAGGLRNFKGNADITTEACLNRAHLTDTHVPSVHFICNTHTKPLHTSLQSNVKKNTLDNSS